MEIAALILSVFALIVSVANLSIMLAKNYFSTHQVQLVPADSLIPQPQAKPLGEEFAEFDQMKDQVLSKAEEEYFKKFN